MNGKGFAGYRLATLILFFLGTVFSAISLGAELLGLDLTPGFGIIQMTQLLVGVTLLTLAGFLHIRGLRGPGAPRSLQADIGVRLAATGLVFAYVAGLADLIGIGTHVEPAFPRPHVGPLQLGGIVLGILSITGGVLLYFTSRGTNRPTSLGADLRARQNGAEEPVPERQPGS